MLQRIVGEKWLKPRGVIGFWPANSIGEDDIEVFADESRSGVLAVVHTLRQQMARDRKDRPNLALADFVAPKESGVSDWLGGFAVTAGHGLDEIVADFAKRHDDYASIMAKALADRLAEAFAERMHERVRKEFWGYAADERLTNEELIAEAYRGIRPAPGYPACPDHTEKRTLFELLRAEENAGIVLTESFAMWPAAAVSGWYFSHPEFPLFRARPHPQGPGRGLRPPQGHELEAANAGSPPISPTTPTCTRDEPQIDAGHLLLLRYLHSHVLRLSHGPPHFHVGIPRKRSLREHRHGGGPGGRLATRAARLVREWSLAHREELMQNWLRGRAFEPMQRIPRENVD